MCIFEVHFFQQIDVGRFTMIVWQKIWIQLNNIILLLDLLVRNALTWISKVCQAQYIENEAKNKKQIAMVIDKKIDINNAKP